MNPMKDLLAQSARNQTETQPNKKRPVRHRDPSVAGPIARFWAQSTQQVRRVLHLWPAQDAAGATLIPTPAALARPSPQGHLRPCAGAIVRDGTNALWVREPQNHFGHLWFTFAKGGLEPEENASDAAVREVREETGLEVALLPGTFAEQSRTTSHNVFFLAKAVGGDPKAYDTGETRCVVSMPVHWLPFYLNNQADRNLLWQLSTDDVAAAQGFCTTEHRPRLQEALERADTYWKSGGLWDPTFFARTQPEPFTAPCKWTSTLRHIDRLEALLYTGLVDAHTTVVFDIDLTLIHSLRPALGRRGMTLPVEGPATLSTLRTLHERGVPVIGLTARHPREADGVLNMLDMCGIDLSVTSPLESQAAVTWPPNAAYARGVLFASDENAKGCMLARLDYHGFVPKHPQTGERRLVLVDDKPMNFYSVFAAAARVRQYDGALAAACVLYDPHRMYGQGGGYQSDWVYLKRIWRDPVRLQAAAHRYQADMSLRHQGRPQGTAAR